MLNLKYSKIFIIIAVFISFLIISAIYLNILDISNGITLFVGVLTILVAIWYYINTFESMKNTINSENKIKFLENLNNCFIDFRGVSDYISKFVLINSFLKENELKFKYMFPECYEDYLKISYLMLENKDKRDLSCFYNVHLSIMSYKVKNSSDDLYVKLINPNELNSRISYKERVFLNSKGESYKLNSVELGSYFEKIEDNKVQKINQEFFTAFEQKVIMFIIELDKQVNNLIKEFY